MLQINHISKTFSKGTANEKTVLDDFSLNVKNGDFITIIGANGAGKSTLFNAISGNFITDSGTIILDGKDITMLPQHVRSRDIGRLFQDPSMGTAPDMSIEENLALASKAGKWMTHIREQDRKYFRKILTPLGMGLEDRLDQPVGLLSGGQRQAIALMMATMNPPKLLLLDEHTAALDPQAEQTVLQITHDIIEKDHLTCLMITHDMQTALNMGNRLIMMNDGKIIYDVSDGEKERMTVENLLAKFRQAVGRELTVDRMLLE